HVETQPLGSLEDDVPLAFRQERRPGDDLDVLLEDLDVVQEVLEDPVVLQERRERQLARLVLRWSEDLPNPVELVDDRSPWSEEILDGERLGDVPQHRLPDADPTASVTAG